MLIVLSPAKSLDFESKPVISKHTVPPFLEESQYLVDKLSKLSPKQLQKMMDLSGNLAQLNYDRFQEWHLPFDLKNAKQAALAFRGDVYIGLDADTYDEGDFEFAQSHIRILSGLYGLLKPLDLIQAYRLEMGCSFKITPSKSNLYKFWDDKITKAIIETMNREQYEVLINLASQEYFKAVRPGLLKKRIVTPVFKDYKNGVYKVIQFFAKKARGSMTTAIVKNKIREIEKLKTLTFDGYSYNDKLSNVDEWVFTRESAPPTQ